MTALSGPVLSHSPGAAHPSEPLRLSDRPSRDLRSGGGDKGVREVEQHSSSELCRERPEGGVVREGLLKCWFS